ncbi:MAG: carboxypeptidase regulatory-like domain-containing protein [Nanoarchaeota archaeon]
MKKKLLDNYTVYSIFVLVLVAITVTLFFFIKTYIGYVTIQAEAGTITEISLEQRTQTSNWQGFYGLGLMVEGYTETQSEEALGGEIESKHLIFNCMEPNIPHEIYASRVDPDLLDWTTALAGSAAWLDDYFNISPTDYDSATNTLIEIGSVMYGDTNITNVPMAYTKKYGVEGSTQFKFGILNVSNEPVFFSNIAGIQKGFNNQQLNYQLLLLSPNESLYYFSPDPNDECPEGYGTGVYGDGYVTGYVIDNSTNETLENVTVGVGGTTTITDGNGFYNLTVMIGYQYIVGILEGYRTHIGLVNVTLYDYTYHNISLNQFVGLEPGNLQLANGTIGGTVRDNRTNQAIENAIVFVAGRKFITDENGFYNGSVYEGNFSIIIMYEGYNNHIGFVNISRTSAIEYNAYIEKTTGTVSGFAVDNNTEEIVENVTVSIGDQSALTNSTGGYTITVRAGAQFIVGTKTGYESYASNITIIPGSIKLHNLSMREKQQGPGRFYQNGSVEGYVIDNSTGAYLSNVTVTIAGISDVTDSIGFYNISIMEGSHNIVAVKSAYENYVNEVNVTANNITKHNISLNVYRVRRANGTFKGTVKNSNGKVIENATISIGGLILYSNSTGGYVGSILEGTYNLVGTKSGYSNYISNITIIPNIVVEHNITLNSTTTGQAENGTIFGKVLDNVTSIAIENASVTINGVTKLSDINGLYNMSVIGGTHNVVAVKDGYENYYSEVFVAANDITEHNISMSVFAKEYANGTITGIVRNSAGAILQNVTISVAGIVTYTNTTGEYRADIIEGSHNLVATRSGYNNYIAVISITAGATTYRNITLNTSAAATSFTGTGAGSGTGVEKIVKEVIQRRIVQPKDDQIDYEISTKKIYKKLRIGSFLNVPITITNYRTGSMNVQLEIDGDAAKLVRLDRKTIAIDPDLSAEFVVTLIGNVDVGIYEGNLLLSGDIEEAIPITVLVYSEEKLPIEGLLMELAVTERRVTIGDSLKYAINFQNLIQEEEYEILLVHNIITKDGELIKIDEDEVTIQTSFSILKNYVIPENFEPGEYFISVEARYLDSVSKQTSVFDVVLPLYMYSFIGIPLWLILAVVLFLGSSTFTVTVYKKKQAEKQRYKSKVDVKNLPAAGDRSAYVGHIAESKTKAYMDLDKFQIHTLIAGTSGSGKSVVAQDLVEEALLKKVAVIVFDPSAQWSGFLRKNEDKEIIKMYPEFGMSKKDARAFPGNIRRVLDGREIIDFKKYMNPGEITVFVTDRLDMQSTELFVANTVREVFHSNLPESPELKYLIVYDGIHTLLPKFGGSGKVFVQIERAAREFRKWGVGLILISQVLSDFPKEVLANINTELQLRTRDEGDLNRIKEEYGDAMLKSVVKATVGASMIENSAYNKGQPYFVAFRPPMHSLKRLSEEELENYTKFNTIIEDLDWQLEQLKEEKLDVFDLELELKLAKSKINSGSFNMVSIYLDGLTPRIQKQWDKLGKAPKKRVIKLADESELERELEEAKLVHEEEKKSVDEETPKAEETPKEEETPEAEETPKAEETPEEEKSEGEIINLINELIMEADKYLDEGDKEKARPVYNEISSLYKKIPKEQRKEIFDQSMRLHKKMGLCEVKEDENTDAVLFEISKVIKMAKAYLKQKDKLSAMEIYRNKLIPLYEQMPAKLKPQLFNQSLDIYKKLK